MPYHDGPDRFDYGPDDDFETDTSISGFSRGQLYVVGRDNNDQLIRSNRRDGLEHALAKRATWWQRI